MREYLDEESAATVTVASRALVFARSRPDLAVHARDYLTLVPLDVDRAGKHVLYFYGYVWSTIDKRDVADPGAAVRTFELVADGRRIPLAPVTSSPSDIGLVQLPVPPPADSAQVLIAATDRETLRFLAVAREVRALALQPGISERYELWTDGRASIASLP